MFHLRSFWYEGHDELGSVRRETVFSHVTLWFHGVKSGVLVDGVKCRTEFSRVASLPAVCAYSVLTFASTLVMPKLQAVITSASPGSVLGQGVGVEGLGLLRLVSGIKMVTARGSGL